MAGNIERKQTEAEKDDFVLLGAKSIYDSINAKLAEVNLKFNKEFKPFDLPCARLDFRDKVEVAERESQRKNGFVDSDNLRIEFGDLDRYGDPKRFELIEEQEDVTQVVVGNIQTTIVVSHTFSYRCKERGHGISVSIPIGIYNEKFAVKKKGEEVKG